MYYIRVVKSSRLLAKINTYLVCIGWLLSLSFLYKWLFFKKISLEWLLTLTTQLPTLKLSDNPDYSNNKTRDFNKHRQLMKCVSRFAQRSWLLFSESRSN